MAPDEREFNRTEAIICSMTATERTDHTLLNASRRRRIAKGSATSVQDVNRLVKQFVEARKLLKKVSQGKLKGVKDLMRRKRRRRG